VYKVYWRTVEVVIFDQIPIPAVSLKLHLDDAGSSVRGTGRLAAP